MIGVPTLALLLTLYLPAAVFIMFASSSMTTGLALSAMIWIFASLSGGPHPYRVQRSDTQSFMGAVLFLGVLTIHLAIASAVTAGIDLSRFAASSAILLLMWMGAHYASKVLLRITTRELVLATDVGLWLMVSFAIAALIGLPPIGSHTSGKPVIVFSEPSHFALVYLPILLFRVAISRRAAQIELIIASLAIAVSLQSLTLVTGVLFASAMMLRRGTLLFLILAIIPILTLADVTYYSDRLDFSANSTNVSTLVFLAGWQNAISALSSTHGIGVGYQQFGIAGDIGDLSNRIAELLGGTFINLRDGGSTAPKILGELGVMGALLIVMYIRQFVGAARYVRNAQLIPNSERDIRLLFLNSMIISYCFELFVRGLGYFSTGGFLALASYMAIRRLPATLSDQSNLQENSALSTP